MSENLHMRAQQLIAQQRVERISTQEETWLAAHLAECEACSAEQVQTAQALAAFRSMNIELPKNLAARTQLRVRLLRTNCQRTIRAACCSGRSPGFPGCWVLPVRLSSGVDLNGPAPSWACPDRLALGVALWWLVPGIVAMGAVLLQKWARADITE